jgi:hypothetical protein
MSEVLSRFVNTQTARALLPRFPFRRLRFAAGLVLPGVALGGVTLLILADLSVLRGVRVLIVDIKRVRGGEQDGYALLCLGVVMVPVIWAAGARRSRLAMAAIAAAGVGASVVVLVSYVPSVGSTAPVNQFYAYATAWTGHALGLAEFGSGLLIVSGVLQLGVRIHREGLLAIEPMIAGGPDV